MWCSFHRNASRFAAVASLLWSAFAKADDLPVISVEGQPLGANVRRVSDALTMLGRPWAESDVATLRDATQLRDHVRLQTLLDKHVLLAVAINPESRVKVLRGPAPAR